MFMQFLITSLCETSAVLKTIRFLSELLKIVLFLVPMILIVMVSIDIGKAVIANDESEMKKAGHTAIRRIIMGMFLILIPRITVPLISLLVNASSTITNYNNCIENMKNISLYEKLEQSEREEEQETYQKKLSKKTSKKIKAMEKANNTTLKANDNKNLAATNSNNVGEEGAFIGKTYNLTEIQIKKIAAMIVHEQGSGPGIIAEANLMANLFELKGHKKNPSLYYYVTHHWFASKTAPVSDATKEAIAVVKTVLVNGRRTLPLYVTEHDCWNCNEKRYCNGHKGDICTLENNGKKMSDLSSIKNRNNYVPDSTKVYTVSTGSKSYWIFYTFPDNHSDPFGYYLDDYKKIKGGN